MVNTDAGGLQNCGMSDCNILEVNTANPFATGLDHILAAVSDLQIAIRIDHGHIAGREPAVFQHIAALLLEIAINNPWSFDQQVTVGLAIPGQLCAPIINDFHVHAKNRAPLFFKHRLFRFFRQSFMLAESRAAGAER
jgi:hypothetical protein